MAKILYCGIHSILEYEELKLLTELGHDCFSLEGAYADPKGHHTLPRPGIPNMTYHEDWHRRSKEFPRTDIPMDFIDSFDIIIVTGGYHDVSVISNNWKRFSKKKVIWRSIGQSVPTTEAGLAPFKQQGLKVVRYSPKERLITNFMGEDACIRFYKEPEEYKDWNGNTNKVITIAQSLKGRGNFCHYVEIMEIMKDLPAKIYGNGNEDLGILNGGAPDYLHLKEVLRDNRVFVYGGTWPAPYTLSFMEALITGIPVVALGKNIAQNPYGVRDNDKFEFYEVHEFINNGINGYVSDSVQELRRYVNLLLSDHSLAKKIGEAGRILAQDLFSKDKIKESWRVFLESL